MPRAPSTPSRASDLGLTGVAEPAVLALASKADLAQESLREGDGCHRRVDDGCAEQASGAQILHRGHRPGLAEACAPVPPKRPSCQADFVVGYRPYLELIRDLLPGKKVFSSSMGKEVDRVRAAVDLLEEGSVALVSSGDPNVYGMAGLGLEMAPQPGRVEIVPGVTSFTAAACRAGLAFRECVAVISLSDLLTPWQDIEGRLRLAAESEMPVALYNPRSKRRDWQLIRALDICGPEGCPGGQETSAARERRSSGPLPQS